MDIVSIIVVILLSLGIGAASGFLGIGGGPLFVPFLLYVLGLEDAIATGTSHALVVSSAVASLIRQKYVQKRALEDFFDANAYLKVAIPTVIGALTVELIINYILGYPFNISKETEAITRRLFAILLLTIGVKMLIWP